MGTPKANQMVRSSDFAAEISKLRPSLQGLAKVLCRNEDAAADLTQETLTRAWQARASFVPGTNLRAWLYTIMRNQIGRAHV